MTKYEQSMNRINNLLRVANYQRTVKGDNFMAASFELKAKIIKDRLDSMTIVEASKCM